MQKNTNTWNPQFHLPTSPTSPVVVLPLQMISYLGTGWHCSASTSHLWSTMWYHLFPWDGMQCWKVGFGVVWNVEQGMKIGNAQFWQWETLMQRATQRTQRQISICFELSWWYSMNQYDRKGNVERFASIRVPVWFIAQNPHWTTLAHTFGVLQVVECFCTLLWRSGTAHTPLLPRSHTHMAGMHRNFEQGTHGSTPTEDKNYGVQLMTIWTMWICNLLLPPVRWTKLGLTMFSSMKPLWTDLKRNINH